MSAKNTTHLREDAKAIFLASLKAVNPVEAVKRHLKKEGDLLQVNDRSYLLADFESIFMVGAGKAGAAMAKGVEQVLGKRLTGGLVNVKYGYRAQLEKVTIHEAGHPVPDEAGMEGTWNIVRLLQSRKERDLVICLISGGGSALLPLPCEGIKLEEKQEITRQLLACGADIREINAIRKHISRVKGGQLARWAHPAQVVTLILSDVVGDPVDAIASGPTAPDQSTFEDCMEILKKYDLLAKVPASVLKHLKAGLEGQIVETPKQDDPIFENVFNLIVASNSLAIRAAADKARQLGYNTLILSSFVEGETKEVARVHAAIAKEVRNSSNPVAPPACIISGGETTVTIRGKGLGGRNQEFVLAAAIDIEGLESTVILSGGTDGTDGPTDAAGAIADGETVANAMKLGLVPQHYLSDNDSYHFFEKLGDLLITGPTNTNVMDLRLVMVG